MKFKQITGGTEEDVYKKFPWLKDVTFKNAVINITGSIFVWEDGTWEGGVWEGGVWEGGVWEGGVWEGGVWEGGKMWSNMHQTFENVIQVDGSFQVIR